MNTHIIPFRSDWCTIIANHFRSSLPLGHNILSNYMLLPYVFEFSHPNDLVQMHGPYSIHAKLKSIWGTLTRHRIFRFIKKPTRNMIFHPRKAKAGSGPIHKEGIVPPNSKSLEHEPQEEGEEKLDDVQDADEEMEDDDEESEEEEGSLYAPTEATSELGEEEPNEYQDSVQLPIIKPCKFLARLPRELRDKIYGYVLKLDTPIADHKLKFKCLSCPSPTVTAKPICQSQIYEARELLRTCHQIRDEGKRVFYEVNSWGLYRARLRETPPAHSSATVDDTQRLFDRVRQIKATKQFRHVNTRVGLSPLAYWDFPVPDNVSLDDPVAIHLFELSQPPSVVAYHKLDEAAQCELFRVVFDGLVRNRADVFPKLRSIKLEVSLHAKKMIPDAPNNPLDRCGITFHVRIKLGRKNRTTPTYHYRASLPISVPSDPYLLQRARYEAHNHNLHPGILLNPLSAPLLDPRRRMLSPLKQLLDVQSVEVERRWTVRYHQPCTEGGLGDICVQPLRRIWLFYTVGEMLERAGPGFCEFMDPALEYLNISHKDVVDIVENTTENIEDKVIR